MDGLLIVDKPSGPTSHDVVARVRRALRERRIGHTGTLDPMASGVLPLVVGRATRLARFLEGEKSYDARVRLGLNTDTYDHLGKAIGASWPGPWPDRSEVEAALTAFRGTVMQQPPAFSAKKIAGRRSYDLARQARQDESGQGSPALPAPVLVTVHHLDLLEVSGAEVRLHLRCSAGFYVRSLAYDLGANLGTGAHLTALRRTEAAGAGLERAVPLEDLEGDGRLEAIDRALVPMDDMLAGLPGVALTGEGVTHARCGRNLGPAETTEGFEGALAALPAPCRLLDPEGRLVAVAEAAEVQGFLHPSVVLM